MVSMHQVTHIQFFTYDRYGSGRHVELNNLCVVSSVYSCIIRFTHDFVGASGKVVYKGLPMMYFYASSDDRIYNRWIVKISRSAMMFYDLPIMDSGV